MSKTLIAAALAAVIAATASAGASYVRQPAPVRYTVPPPIAPHVPDVRMPGTQFRGVNYYQQGYRQGHNGGYFPIRGVPHRFGHAYYDQQYQYERHMYRNHRHQTVMPSGYGAAHHAPRRPNVIKQEFVAGCAAHGAPVTQIGGGGRMHCHRDPSVITIID